MRAVALVFGYFVNDLYPVQGIRQWFAATLLAGMGRHFDHVINVHVILSVEKLRQKAEATLHVNGAKVFADSVHEDMYAAIDTLIDKLDRQVLKHKEKKSSHRGNGFKGIETD